VLNQAIHKELIERVKREALSANIQIVLRQGYSDDVNSTSTSYAPSASGVVIGKEGNRYYALTAYHVISKLADVSETKIIVLGYGDLHFIDYLRGGGEYKGLDNYYQQFPNAVIEYVNDKYDLALISFETDEIYTVLVVANDAAKYGDIVASMSNPNGDKNIITAGKISSRKPRPFSDEAGKMQYPIIKHTAMLSEGSSGSALLNEDLEVVGINLGGNENIFRQFISGMAMPSDRICTFLDEWEN